MIIIKSVSFFFIDLQPDKYTFSEKVVTAKEIIANQQDQSKQRKLKVIIIIKKSLITVSYTRSLYERDHASTFFCYGCFSFAYASVKYVEPDYDAYTGLSVLD